MTDHHGYGRPAWLWITPTALLVVLITWVAGTGPVFVVGEPFTNPTRPGESGATPPPWPAETAPPPPQAIGVEGHLSWVVRWIVLTVLLIGVAALIVVLLRHWRERRLPVPTIIATPLHDAVSAAAAEQQELLRSRAPRGAIIACWERMEQAVTEAGVPPLPWQTPTELTADVLKSLPVDPAAIDDLASLYREARFSTHTFDDAERDRALVALRRLHDDLSAASAAAAAAAAASATANRPPAERSDRVERAGGARR